jgi:hypothetical protein
MKKIRNALYSLKSCILNLHPAPFVFSKGMLGPLISPVVKESLTHRPWWRPIHTRFQAFLETIAPETQLVALPWPESWAGIIYLSDIFFNPAIEMTEMLEGRCHDNVEELCKTNKSYKHYTGYALSADRKWRYHSWALKDDGTVVQTTERRLVYIGSTVVFW